MYPNLGGILLYGENLSLFKNFPPPPPWVVPDEETWVLLPEEE